MSEMGKRLKELRLALGLYQSEFGEILNLSPSGVCDLENGRRQVKESHLIMLSNYKDKMINIDWVRTGTGEMFKSIDSVLSELSFGEDEFLKDFVKIYLSLDSKSKQVLKNIMDQMAQKYIERKFK